MAVQANNTISSLKKELLEGVPKPVYLLHGDEPWFIDQLIEIFEDELIPEHERDFNLTVVYGRDSAIDQIVGAAQRFPMMAERQVVIVKEAQDLDGWRREADRDYLEKYLLQPQPTTVLVFAHKYKKLAGNTKVFKAFSKHGEVIQFDKIPEGQLSKWISDHASSIGITLQPDVSLLLSEYLGTDLSKVVHAIEKLKFTVGDGETITTAHVEKYIGISKDYNVFELQNAICAHDLSRAIRIISYFADNQKNHPIQMTMGFLYTFYSKLLIYHGERDKSNNHMARVLKLPWVALESYRFAGANYPELKVMQNISVLRKYDRMLKGVTPTGMSLLDIHRQLIYELMN